MKENTTKLASALFAFATTLTAAALLLAPGLHAQEISTDTVYGPPAGAVPAVGGTNINLDFIVDEGATLTFQGAPGWAGARGSIFYSSSAASPVHLTAISNGGVIVFDGQGDATHKNVTNQGGAILAHTSAGSGSYITLVGGTTVFTTGTIKNFWANTNGGFAYLQSGMTGNTLTLNNFIVTGNGVASASNATSSVYGGAISLGTQVSQNLLVDNVTFSHNQVIGAATGLGGAIHTNATATSTISLSNVTFDGNSATGGTGPGQGGAIWSQTSRITLTNATFTNNTANTQGGALYINADSVTITANEDSTSAGNYAGATPTAAYGGFAYIAGAGTLALNAASGITLTIGDAVNTDADTIIGAAATGHINFNADDASTGVITLNGNSAANLAAVNVAAGFLKLANDSAALGGPVTIASGARAGGVGTLGTSGQSVTLASGATLQAGLHNGSEGILNIAGNLVLNGGSFLDFNVYSDTSADLLNIAGSLTQAGASAATLNVSQIFTTGSIALINVAGGLATYDPDLLTLTLNNAATSDAYLTNDSNFIYLVFGAPPAPDNNVLFWTGASGSSWVGSSWLAQGSGTTYVKGDIINLADDTTGAAAPDTATINIDTTGAATVAALYISGTTSYTVTGNAITTSATLGTFTGSGAATGKLVLGAQAAPGGDSFAPAAFTGTLTLSNTYNTFTGGIDINAGELVGNALTLATGAAGASGTVTIAAPGTLTFDQAAAGAYASPITGSGHINKNNTGALTLAGNSSAFKGVTDINAGSLILNGALGGAIDINAGATLTGSGTAAAVNLNTGGAFVLSSTFTITGALTLAADTTLTYNTSAGGSLIAGSLVRAGASTIDITSPFNGSYKLLEITGAGGLPASATDNLLLTLNGADPGFRIVSTFSIVGNSLYLDLTSANFNLAWSGTNGATWRNNYANFQSSDGVFMNGDAAQFDDTVDALSGTRAVAVDAAGVQAVDMRVSTTGAYTFTGGGITTSNTLASGLAGAATGKLTIDGPGLVTFANAGNHFEGGILVASGTLALGANNALGAADSAPALTLANAAVFTPGGYLQTLGEVNTGAATTIAMTTGTVSGTIAFAGGGVINGAITGTGQIQVTGGNLAINSANASLAAPIVINGGTATLASLQGLGAGAVTINAGGALAFANSGTGTFANVYSGAGRLMFTGSGTTTLASSRNNFTGSAYIAPGASVMVTQVAALGNTPTSVEIDDGGKVTYSTSSGVIANNISGSGTLQIQSASTSGTQTFNGAVTVANIVALTTGQIIVASANSFGTPDTNITLANVLVTFNQPNMSLGHLDLHGGARVQLDPSIPVGSTLTIASINATDPVGTTPTIRVNTDIGAGTASKIIITGGITGHLNLAATNTGDVPAAMQVTVPLIEFPAGSDITFGGVGAFAIPGSLTAYSYIIDPVTGDLTATNTGQLSLTGASLIANASGAMPLTWFAELDTLAQRLRDLRMDARPAPGWDRWVRGYTQRLKVNDKDMLVPFREDQYGIEVGLDYGGARKDAGHRGYVGAFIGFGNAQRIVDYFAPDQNARGNTTSFYAGVYATLVADSGWYLDLVGKYNFFKNNFTAVIDPTAPMRSNVGGAYNDHALGASIEFGKRIGKPTGFYITPSAQAALALITGAGYATDEYTSLNVNMSSITTRQFRASITAGRAWAMKDGRIFQAYIKAGAARQWTSGGVITVTKPSFDFESSYSPSINGARCDAGAGFNWKISDEVQVYFDYDASWARDYQKPCGLNLGCTIAW